MTTQKPTAAQIDAAFRELSSFAEASKRRGEEQIRKWLAEAYDDEAEVPELRRQLSKAIRKAVQLDRDLMELQAQIDVRTDLGPVIISTGFIIGPRAELHLDQILPGYPIVFTDPVPPKQPARAEVDEPERADVEPEGRRKK